MKKTIAAGTVALVAVVVAGALGASAYGGGFGMRDATPEQLAQFETQRFQHQAEILGISVDKVKAAWATGTTLLDLAKESGLTEQQLQAKLQAERTENMKQHLDVLVSQGVITQQQADQRLTTLKNRVPGQGRGDGMGMHGRGMGGGFGL